MVLIMIICITVITCITILIYIMQRNKYLRNENMSLRTMFDNMQSYVFLIDSGINVKRTNYYNLNPDASNKEPLILGNVLKCKYGCDAGLCGKSPYCEQCSISEYITTAFQTKNDFKNVEAHMHIYTINHNVIEIDVVVDGKYVEIDNNPYMVIDVKDITSTKALQHLYLEEKLRSQQDSKRYESLISKFIDNISSPFNTFSGYINMFLDAKTQEEQENSVKFINTQALFIKNWIEDFISHDLIRQVKQDTVHSDENLKSNDIQAILPKLLITTADIELFNKIKDYTNNKFFVERELSDLDLAVHAAAAFDIFAIIVDLAEERLTNLIKSLHDIKPKLPIIVLIGNTDKSNFKYGNSRYTIPLSRNFNQTGLITYLDNFKE